MTHPGPRVSHLELDAPGSLDQPFSFEAGFNTVSGGIGDGTFGFVEADANQLLALGPFLA